MTRLAVFLLALALAGCNGSGGSDQPEPPPGPDRKPILTLTEPLEDTVATPEVLVTASCTDDRGDCTLAVAVDSGFGDSLAVGELGNELSRELDLSDFDGQTVSLDVTAIDSAGQTRSESRRVHVEGSPDLTNESAFPLRVVDFDGQRALLQREVDPMGSELTIVEVASGREEHVDVVSRLFTIRDAYLTPTGAAFAGLLEDALPEAYDWNHSLLLELGASQSIAVAGDYAVWIDEVGSELVRRRFSTMTNLHVRDADAVRSGSVASNGVVVFSEQLSFEVREQIVKFDEGAYTTLTADADKHNHSPRTDGQGVVYYKTNAERYEIAFHDGTDEIILTGPRSELPQTPSDFAIAGGWVAFTELGDLGQTHVWTRDSSGTLLQRTAFDIDSLIETLAPDGEVMVVTTKFRVQGKSGQIARYLSRPTGELTQVSSELGWSTKIGDTWYVIIGRSVFEVR